MGVEIITKEDLERFRIKLLEEIALLIGQLKKAEETRVEGYKTSHVRQILCCSVNKLNSLKVAGKIRCKKIGGTLYYNKEDVRKLLSDWF